MKTLQIVYRVASGHFEKHSGLFYELRLIYSMIDHQQFVIAFSLGYIKQFGRQGYEFDM